MSRIDNLGTFVHLPFEGFPEGTEELANHRSRLECWEGPLGGFFHFSFRGNAGDFNDFVSIYSRIASGSIELHIVDGPSHTFGDHVPNDWTLSLGSSIPVKGLPLGQYSKSVGPLAVFIGGGGSIKWEEVHVPKGVRVLDLRKSSITDKRDRAILNRIESLGCEVRIYMEYGSTLIVIRHPERPEPLRVKAADISSGLREIEANMDAPVEPVSLPAGQ